MSLIRCSCINEVTLEKLLITSGWWLVANRIIRGLEFLVPSSDFEGGERGGRLKQSIMASKLINPACVMKPLENPKRMVFGELLGW